MLKGLIALSWYSSYGGGEIGNFLQYAEELGAFSYLLPFLLIFALVNGILSRMNIFNENRAINPIISFVVGLLALQFEFVPQFFSEVFPRLGVGLAIILIILIVGGLFFDTSERGLMLTLLGVSVVIIAVVLIQSGVAQGSNVAYWFEDHWGNIAWIVGLVIVLSIVAGLSSNKSSKPWYPTWPYGAPPNRP